MCAAVPNMWQPYPVCDSGTQYVPAVPNMCHPYPICDSRTQYVTAVPNMWRPYPICECRTQYVTAVPNMWLLYPMYECTVWKKLRAFILKPCDACSITGLTAFSERSRCQDYTQRNLFQKYFFIRHVVSYYCLHFIRIARCHNDTFFFVYRPSQYQCYQI